MTVENKREEYKVERRVARFRGGAAIKQEKYKRGRKPPEALPAFPGRARSPRVEGEKDAKGAQIKCARAPTGVCRYFSSFFFSLLLLLLGRGERAEEVRRSAQGEKSLSLLDSFFLVLLFHNCTVCVCV